MTSQWPVWARHGVCVSRCTHGDYVGLMALSWSAADAIGGASDRVLVPGSDNSCRAWASSTRYSALGSGSLVIAMASGSSPSLSMEDARVRLLRTVGRRRCGDHV